MSSRHIVSEMVSSINVALRSNFMTAVVSRNNFITEIVNILYLNGFIRGFVMFQKNILIHLKYHDSKPVINALKVVSTPGKRVY